MVPLGGSPAGTEAGRDPVEAPAGLSQVHIPPGEVGKSFDVAPEREYLVGIQGGVIKFCRHFGEDGDLAESGGESRGGRRGRVTVFSRASRRRLLRRIRAVDFRQAGQEDHVVYFVSPTYPFEFPSAAASKCHLEAFIKRVGRQFPGAFGVWKIEPQQRGAPHYHLLLAVPKWHLGGESPRECRSWFRHWAADAWCDVVGSEDPKHRAFHHAAREFVEEPRSSRGIASYIGKYMNKPESGEWQQHGRWWGIINKMAMMEYVHGNVWRVERWVYLKLRRLFRRHCAAVAQVRKRIGRGRASRGVDTWYTFDRGENDGVSLSMVTRLMMSLVGSEFRFVADYEVSGWL